MSTSEATGDIAPLVVSGWLAGAALIAVALTPILSWIVLTWFRRVVSARMAVDAPPSGPSRRWGSAPGYPVPGYPVPGWPPRQPGTALPPPGLPPGAPGALAGLVRRRRRTALAWYTGAALLYGLVASVSWLTARHLLDPVTAATLTVVFAWPWVPTTVVVLGLRRARAALLVAGYMLVLVAVASTGLEGLVGGLFAPVIWLAFAASASVLMLAVAAPRLRAAGPHLALTAFLLAAGVTFWPWIAADLIADGMGYRTALLLGVVVPLVLVPLSLANLALAARRYGRKTASEQSLSVDQWWLVFTLFQCLLSLESSWAWLGMLAAYGLYRAVTAVGRAQLAREAAARPGPRLLLLRVFDRGRGERLLRDVGASWRYVGSVHLIAGWDLATATMEPGEFLDFVLGRLARHFVTGPQELAARLTQMDVVPDGDGRYRVNDFFCYRNSWRETVQALVDRVDVVLIDLRGLTSRNEGVAFELQHLVQIRALHRVVALVDSTTDDAHLQRVLEGTARGASQWLRVVRVDDGVDAMNLLDLIDVVVRRSEHLGVAPGSSDPSAARPTWQ